MPKMSKKITEELLHFLGWKKEEEVWSHHIYQREPGDIPDVNSTDCIWWLMDWLLAQDYIIKFCKSHNLKSDKRYCTVNRISDRSKWTARDYPRNKPNQAILTLLLKIKRFPNGQPRKKDEYYKALVKGKTPDPQELKKRLFECVKPQFKELSKLARKKIDPDTPQQS